MSEGYTDKDVEDLGAFVTEHMSLVKKALVEFYSQPGVPQGAASCASKAIDKFDEGYMCWLATAQRLAGQQTNEGMERAVSQASAAGTMRLVTGGNPNA